MRDYMALLSTWMMRIRRTESRHISDSQHHIDEINAALRRRRRKTKFDRARRD